MSIVPVYDSTHANISRLPHGQRYAGYTTGSASIKWTAEDWKNHPGAVRFCQDNGSDDTADVIDDENGAATDADVALWVPRAWASYRAAKRPGQRKPTAYKSVSGITALVNTLIAHGIRSGVNLWPAHWGEADKAARAEVREAAGPFPIVGIQNHNLGSDDESWVSEAWLNDVSADGPFRHITTGDQSVTDLAHLRNMRPGAWLTLQGKLGGEAVETALGGENLKAGLPWYSNTP